MWVVKGRNNSGYKKIGRGKKLRGASAERFCSTFELTSRPRAYGTESTGWRSGGVPCSASYLLTPHYVAKRRREKEDRNLFNARRKSNIICHNFIFTDHKFICYSAHLNYLNSCGCRHLYHSTIKAL